jgi:hypothetical protein
VLGLGTVVSGSGIWSARGADSRFVSPTGPAVTSGKVLDSFGINAHWHFLDTPYGVSYEKVRDLLVASGIPHVRGELGRVVGSTDRVLDLFSRGVRTTLLVDKYADNTGDPLSQVAELADFAAMGAIGAVEGVNEGDIAWPSPARTYKGESFPRAVSLWQDDLYQAMKSDPRTVGVPVIGPSFGKTYWDGTHPFAPGSLADNCDYGNMHPYPRGNPYTDKFAYGGIDQYYNNSDFPSNTLDSPWDVNFETYRPPFGDRPMMVTESGYSTYRLGVNERVQSRYTLRLYLEYLRLGIERTYLYELVDPFADSLKVDRERNFGLLRRDLTPKPAYFAVKNFLGLLKKDATSAAPVAFTPVISVTPSPGYDPAQVHHVVISKGGGNYLIALWHEVSANDTSGLDLLPPKPPVEVSHPAITVRVDAGRAVRSISAEYMADDGTLRYKALARDGNSSHVLIGQQVTLMHVRL